MTHAMLHCKSADLLVPAPSLEEAFRRFGEAARSLEEGHRALGARIATLEGQLLQAHRRLETVLDGIDHGVALIGPDGILLQANREFREMGLGETQGPVGNPELAGAIHAAEDSGTALRLRHETALGIRDMAVVIRPVEDDPGTHLASVHDVTEIRREEEEGGRRRRLEALGRVAAEVAHEVRNPLGGIRLLAAMLREDLDDRPNQREMAEQILEAVAGLEGVVTNLLALAGPGKAAPRRADLAEIATQACAVVAPSCAARGVRLAGPAQTSGLNLRAEPEALRQIVLNLLSNALAATDAGGTIEVRTESDSRNARLVVRDSGRGIAAEDLPKVFDPFFTRTEGGTGLGLSIVHAIVERHGGRIRVESRPGHGTNIHVTLPAAGEQEALHA